MNFGSEEVGASVYLIKVYSILKIVLQNGFNNNKNRFPRYESKMKHFKMQNTSAGSTVFGEIYKRRHLLPGMFIDFKET